MDRGDSEVSRLSGWYLAVFREAVKKAYCRPEEDGMITVHLVFAAPASPNFLADLSFALVLDEGRKIAMRVAGVRRVGNTADLALSLIEGEATKEVGRGLVLSNIAEIEIGDGDVRFRITNLASRSAFERSCAAMRSAEEDVIVGFNPW